MDDKYLGLTEYKRSKLKKFFRSGWISEGYNLQNVGTLVPKRARGKMSTVCQNFVQNTWKKDFCSNCFKSKDEHNNEKNTTKSGGYFSSFHNKSPKLNKSSPGILKLTSPKKKSKRTVSFPQELTKVIGYGGEVWSDDEEFQMSEDTGEDDFIPDCEEEKQLKKLTKSNTDFNTVKENLLGSNGETKKSYTSLLLGKMQTDSEGKKKTLLVSVTPFGHENSIKNTISKLNNETKSSVASVNKNKENRNGDYKTNIILTSFVKNTDSPLPVTPKKDDTSLVVSEKSLLEEISETLEKNRINVSKNNLEIDEVKKTHIYSNVVNGKFEEKTKESDPIVEKSVDTTDFKKNAITRNTPVKKDSEKPKITMMPKAHQEFTFCKIDIEPAKPDNNINNEITNKKYSIDSSKSMASDEDSTSSKSDSDVDDRQYIETCNPLKKSEGVKIQVFSDGKDTDLDDKTSSDVSLEDIRKVDGQSDGSLQDTYEIHFQPQILDLPPIIPKIDQSDIFPMDASRESAGEPDGRADPEDMSEPPALPRSPPPQVDPRPSFLHGMFKDNNICRPVVPEKPKLPVKPLSVIKQITKRPQANVLPQQQQIIMHVQTLNAPVRACTPEPSPVKEEVEICEAVIAGNDNNNITFDDNEDYEMLSKTPLGKQDSNCSANMTPNKRKAPKPPPPGVEETSGTIYQRNPTANIKSDSPVVREKEKRERASSCSPKFRQGVNLNPTGNQQQPNQTIVEKLPEPAPRRSISLSHDNLIDEKKKNKSKFSLRKLLRIGSSKDLDKKELHIPFESTIIRKDELSDLTPKPKPRLVIIHPLELNGSSVEVLKSTPDLSSICKTPDNISISDDSTYSGFSAGDSEDMVIKDVSTKPPPPPRKVTEEICTIDGCPTKPARPPPPKSAALLKQQKQATWSSSSNTKPADNVYANLGEVRSAIAPRKPERTASMREREAQLELPKKRYTSAEDSDGDIDCSPSSNIHKVEITHTSSEQSKHNYDDVYGSEHKYESPTTETYRVLPINGNDNDYEFVSNCTSSTPQSNLVSKKIQSLNTSLGRLPVKTMIQAYRKSDCSINKSSEYMKFNNFTRSTSLTYYGSETESEIYSPYSFYSCSEVNDNEIHGEFSNGIPINNTTNKLRVRKGRSVVHKNLEDNYGAVVIANHEALAQVLEQVQQSAIMQPSLRGLKTCTNLRWNDFTITSTPLKSPGSLRVGKRVFYSAVWNSNSANGAVNVTLMLHKDQMASQLVSQQFGHQQAFCLNAVTEFCDLVPLQQFGEEGDQLVQATVVVLAHTQVDTVHTFGDYLKNKGQSSPTSTLQKNNSISSEKELPITSEYQHEATFVMLQMINGLKCLQARGVEEVPASLSSFVILRDHQAFVNGQQNGSCNLSDSASEDGPPSIQMPKANSYGRLCILQGLIEETVCHIPTDEKMSSLCECAITTLKLLIPDGKLAILIQNLLKQEKSISLSQVKSILEFTLWGPIDVVLGLPVKERELSLQRWLDLERATVLHGLVRSRVQLNVFEQSHLMFLVRSSAKAMCEASVLLETSKIY